MNSETVGRKQNYIILGLSRFRADLLATQVVVGNLDISDGGLTQRVNQLGEELGNESWWAISGKLLADATDDYADILSILEFHLNTERIQNQGTGHAVACCRKNI